MGPKIIKLTESKLKNIVSKIILEEINQTRIDSMVNTYCKVRSSDGLIDYPESSYHLVPWAQYKKDYGVTDEEESVLKTRCVGYKTPQPPSTNITERQKTLNNAFCSSVGGMISFQVPGMKNISYSVDQYVKMFNVTPEELAIAKASCPKSELSLGKTAPKMNWVKQSGKFPLKYGEVGGNIGTLQKALGMRGDTYFGTRTEKGILTKAPEYKRETGVTQEIYNKIVSNISIGKDMKTTYDMNTDAGKSAYLQQAFKPAPQLFKNIQNVPQLTSQQQSDINRIGARPDYGTPTPPVQTTTGGAPEGTIPPTEDEIKNNPQLGR